MVLKQAPPTVYYIPDFITEAEEECLLQQVDIYEAFTHHNTRDTSSPVCVCVSGVQSPQTQMDTAVWKETAELGSVPLMIHIL